MTTYYMDWEGGCDFTADASPLGHSNFKQAGSPALVFDQVRVKYGAYAMNLSSASSDSGLYVQSHPGFQFGAGQFTIEGWFNWSGHVSSNWEELITNWASNSNSGWGFEMAPTNTLQFSYSTTGTNVTTISGAYTPPANTWVHMAVDRDASNVIRVYANGVVIASATAAVTFYPSTRQVGVGNNENFNARFPGWIGGVRITKGVARYAGAFTPPTSAFPTNVAGDPNYNSVTLLLNFDVVGLGTSFATRWKTLTFGASLSRVAAGDTVRIMGSPDPTLVGNATWTNNSRTVTLPSAVTQLLSNCEAAWTGSANVTSTVSSNGCKDGVNRAVLDIAAAFTTGLVGYQLVMVASAPTMVNRASNLLGAGTLTLLQNANADEGVVSITLPFAVMYNGRSYTTIYVSSNSFVAFGTSAQAYTNISASIPAVPNIQINTGDRSYQRVYGGSEDGNATYRIRYEGSTGTNGTVGSSTIIWEMTFSAATPDVIKIDLGANAASGTGVSGCSDGAGTYVASFASGTANTGYTMTSPAPAVDLSSYQQVSFWFYASQTFAANTLSLRLCSDAAGQTVVNTLPLPAYNFASQWTALTLDNGAALGSSIRSIALYADLDPGTITFNIDHIIACKAPGIPESLSLTSLVGKAHNLSWAVSTAYLLNAVRRPSQPNRNGFSYKVTTAGTTGATEPVWPPEYGVTVTDGSVVWTCTDLEDTWYPIASITGTTVRLDAHPSNAPTTTYGAYQGATETVATYKREAVRLPTMPNGGFDFTWNQSLRPGTETAWVTYSGGWNRTDMSTQTGETWLTGQNGGGMGFYADGGATYMAVSNVNLTRFSYGLYATNGNSLIKASNLHANACGTGVYMSGRRLIATNVVASSNNANGIDTIGMPFFGTCITCNGNGNGFPGHGMSYDRYRMRINYMVAKGNGGVGLNASGSGRADAEVRNLVTANNVGAGTYAGQVGGLVLVSAVMTDATAMSTPNNFVDGYVYSHKHGGIAGAHLITTDGGTIRSVTDVRHAATGIAWRFNPTSINRNAAYPLRLAVARIACTANASKTVRIWTRRDNANIKGELAVEGGQLPGVPMELVTACAPTVNTWEQSAALTFTPTETGVVEVLFRVYDGVNTANNFWIDDLTVTTVSGTTYASWSPADLSAGVTLSNSNLTATGNSGTDNGVRASQGKSSGKYYVEFTTGASFAGGDTGVGLALASASLTSVGGAALSAVAVFASGGVWLNGGQTGIALGTIPANTVVGMAVDLDNHRIWFRNGSGNWNNNAGNSPTSPTTGVDTSSLSGALYPLFCVVSAGSSVTANFGGTAFAYPVPSGFQSGWY